MSLIGRPRYQPVPEVESTRPVVQSVHEQSADADQLGRRKRAFHGIGQQPRAESAALCR